MKQTIKRKTPANIYWVLAMAIFTILIILLSGCSTVPLTDEEREEMWREYRERRDREDWERFVNPREYQPRRR